MGRGRVSVRLVAQVQARTQQRAAATGQYDCLLVVAHETESNSTAPFEASVIP
jgi:hypothetical protein